MVRRGHAEDTWAGLGWFIVILAMGVGAYLLIARSAGPAVDPFSGGLDVELRADLADAREAGRVDDWEDDATLLRQTADVVAARVRQAGVKPVRVVVVSPDRLHLRLPSGISELTPELKRAFAGGGGATADAGALAFRLVVSPTGWTDETITFSDLKAQEVLRWQQAQVDRGTYVSGHAGYRIVPRLGSEGDEAWDFAVVRDAANPTELFFGSAMLEQPRVSPAENGRQRLHFRVKPSLRGHFRKFTAKHLNQRLAIIADGEIVAMPALSTEIDAALEIVLDRRMTPEEAETLAKRWVGAGPLRVRCYYVGEARIP